MNHQQKASGRSALSAWLARQEKLHPSSVDLGLARVSQVAERLGITRPPFPVITIAGTNGKGSCAALLESILEEAGYRVGTYTSPHLVRYNERVRINGHDATDEALIRAFDEIDEARGDVTLTYFEFGTLAAMVLFNKVRVDVALLEVGLGGRLDAVNTFDADVALITSIGIDHVDWLGPDRASIGREKAGICRPGHPAVCGDSTPPASVEAHARAIGAPWYRAGRDFRGIPEMEALPPGNVPDTWRWEGPGGTRHSGLPLPALAGGHQIRNAAAAIMVLELIRDRLPVSWAARCRGLTRVRLAGRFQVLTGEDGVTTILDVGHNPQAAQAIADTLTATDLGHSRAGRTLAVVAMLKDKDIESVLRVMWPVVDAWYAAGIDVPRGANIETLMAAMSRITSTWRAGKTTPGIHPFPTVAKACRAASQAAERGDVILIFGSFYTVSEALNECGSGSSGGATIVRATGGAPRVRAPDRATAGRPYPYFHTIHASATYSTLGSRISWG